MFVLARRYNSYMSSEIKPPSNPEIEQALREFDAKESQAQVVKTEKVARSSMVDSVMKYAGIKERKNAEYFLLVFTALLMVIAFFVLNKGTNSNNDEVVDEFINSHPEFFRKR